MSRDGSALRTEGAPGHCFGETIAISRQVPIKGLTPPEIAGIQSKVSALSELHHPNILRWVDSFQDSTFLNIVTEFVEGIDCEQRLGGLAAAGLAWPDSDERPLIRGVLKALDFAHAKRYMHRDVKPVNIWWSYADDAPRLANTGLTHALGATSLAGTPAFMAPEIFQLFMRSEAAAAASYTPAADVWSAGVTFHYLLSGKLLCDGGRRAGPKWVAPPLPAHVEPAVARLIARMLRVKPGDRPSIKELLKELDDSEPMQDLTAAAGAGAAAPSATAATDALSPTDAAIALPVEATAPSAADAAAAGASEPSLA